MINKSLYEITRGGAEQYIKGIENESGLEQYFVFLDQETAAISKTLDNTQLLEQRIEEAGNRVLSQLEDYINTLGEET